MKTSLFFFVITISFAISFAQQPLNALRGNQEIGVDEKLGNTIPLDLKFTNENDKVVSLRSIIRKPTILSLVYFDCPSVCSPLLDGVSDVMEKTVAQLGKDYQVITVSFNYKDTPEKARQKKGNFMGRHSKDNAPYWNYLTGDSASIHNLAQSVGFKFKRSGQDFLHPAVIMVLSPTGKITRYLYGINFVPADVNLAIADAQKGEIKQSVNKVLLFCYTYNAEENKYVLSASKIAGISAGLIFLIVATSLVMAARKKRKHITAH